LINALTGRKALARTSHTPGRTQELIFFAGPPHLTLVDMPGYGYAAASKTKVKAWTELIHAYLRGRANLARVYVLIDARHGLKTPDADVLASLDEAAVSYQIVLTKADRVAAALEPTIDAVGAAIARRPAAFPELIATSAREGTGIAELRAAGNQRWNITGDSRSRTACPTHMPPHTNANAASVAQAIEMLSPPATATLTPSAIVETVKDSPRA